MDDDYSKNQIKEIMIQYKVSEKEAIRILQESLGDQDAWEQWISKKKNKKAIKAKRKV